MVTIRELFHEIGNWHNKISVAAGVAKATLKQKTKTNPSGSAEVQDILGKLSQIEQHALGADKALRKLKNTIYEKMDPDTARPKK
jgi:hypothetical protein